MKRFVGDPADLASVAKNVERLGEIVTGVNGMSLEGNNAYIILGQSLTESRNGQWQVGIRCAFEGCGIGTSVTVWRKFDVVRRSLE